MGSVSILKMRCPVCAGPLKGRAFDSVFPCSSCARYFEVKDAAFIEREVVACDPIIAQEGDMLFYAPTWEFEVETSVDARPDEIEDATRIAAGFTKVYVSAFRMWRPGYFGIPGHLYTLAQIKPVMRENMIDKPTVLGCRRSMKDAFEFIKPTLMSAIDRKIDIAYISVSGEILGARLLAIPYVLKGDRVLDTMIKWDYPTMMFEDLADLVET